MSLADGSKSFEQGVGPLMTLEADQGILTIAEDIEVWNDGSEDIGRTWSDKINAGNLIRLLTTGPGFRVQNAPAEDQALLGIAHEKARPRKGVQEPGDAGVYDDSPLPKVFREVQVELYSGPSGPEGGPITRNYAIGTDGATVAPALGQSVKHDTAGGTGTPTQHSWEGSGSLIQGQNMVLRIFVVGSVTFATVLLSYGGLHA